MASLRLGVEFFGQKKGPIPSDQAIAGEWNAGTAGQLAGPFACRGDVARRSQYVAPFAHWGASIAEELGIIN
jgi:hypothetical protein